MATFRLILVLAAQYGWDVDHMDVVTAFLNPRIDQDNIYMEMPLGIDWLASNESASSGSILILQKALYGLKPAPRLWYEDIDGYLQSIGFRQSAEDLNLYLQQGVLLVLYMDDLLIAHNRAEGRGVTLGLSRNRSVGRIKGNQATFNNSQQNNLRSCVWVRW